MSLPDPVSTAFAIMKARQEAVETELAALDPKDLVRRAAKRVAYAELQLELQEASVTATFHGILMSQTLEEAQEGVRGFLAFDAAARECAELAMEVMGTKLVTEFLRETWANATPEAKKELADAVLKHMIKIVEDRNPWELDSAIREKIGEVARAHAAAALDSKTGVIQERFMALVDETSETVIREAVRAHVDGVVKGCLLDIGSKLGRH